MAGPTPVAHPVHSGPIRALYGPVIRDKCKSADLDTLKAYHTVGHDLLKEYVGEAADDLKAALGDLEKAIKAKS